MIDHAQLERDLVPIIRLITGLPIGKVIRGNPNENAPDGEYCTVTVQNEQARGQANVTMAAVDSSTITQTVAAQKIVRVQLNFYRGRAKQLAGTLVDADKRYPVFEALYQANIGWFRVGPTQNMTEVFNGAQEPRAIVELYLLIDDSVSDTIARADNVTLAAIEENSGTTVTRSTNDVLPG
ncbi:MAG: hypothetical protein R3268_05930 [Acidiferrobacterales bacterium]|nr:hypothetical protein [Acidiferrobacterales bacterium]